MARGRFISKSISLDAKIARLSSLAAQLLWTWMIPHIDVQGRFYGEATIVRSLVFPRQQVDTQEVEDYLDEMHKAGLLVRYQVDGEQYLYFPNFSKHQVGLRVDRESPSNIPPWSGEATPTKEQNRRATPEAVQSNDGATPEAVPHKSKVSKDKISKANQPSAQNLKPTPDRDYLDLVLETKAAQDKRKYPITYLTETAAQLLGLKMVPNHKFDELWESPITDLLAQADGDIDRVEAALRAAVQEGQANNMTMTTPNSLHGIALKALAQGNRAESYDDILARQKAREAEIEQEIIAMRGGERD